MPRGYTKGLPLQPPHIYPPASERFWGKVKKADGKCWEWLGAKDRLGYGRFYIGGGRKNSIFIPAHTYAYEEQNGKIPKGFEIDHLCRNHSCVNPSHLEAVTPKENCKRGLCGLITGAEKHARTHCSHGHEYTLENTYFYGRKRICKICLREHEVQYRQERRYITRRKLYNRTRYLLKKEQQTGIKHK